MRLFFNNIPEKQSVELTSLNDALRSDIMVQLKQAAGLCTFKRRIGFQTAGFA